MNMDMKEPLPAMMDVDVAVRKIMKAIRRRKNFLTFPWAFGLGLGVLRWLPDWLSDWFVVRYLTQGKK